MGRKQPKTRKYILFCIASLILSTLLGCVVLEKQKKVEVVQEKIEKEAPEEATLKIFSKHLQRAKKFLEERDYDGSLKENQKALSLSESKAPGDEALFNMGLIYAHFENPKKDYRKSLTFFNRLMKEYPHSPLFEQAKIWAGVLQGYEKLNQTVEKLYQVIEESKKVDLQIEEMKREKTK